MGMNISLVIYCCCGGGPAVHQHVLLSLSQTLTMGVNETAKYLTNLQKSLDSLPKVILDNRMA